MASITSQRNKHTFNSLTVHQHLQGQIGLAMRLAYPCHLQIRAQFLCIIHPHVPGDAMGPGLIAHSYNSVEKEYVTNKFKQSKFKRELSE